MQPTFETFEVTNRVQFGRLVCAARERGTFVSYGRLNQFGRSLITTEYKVIMPAICFSYPPMNVHRRTTT